MKNKIIVALITAIVVTSIFLLYEKGCFSTRSKFDIALNQYNNEQFKEAMDNFMPLAQQGNPYAEYYMGSMFYDGRGTTKDFTRAFKWLTKSSNQNCHEAQYLLAKMYMKGNNVKKDPKLASQLILKSANGGYGKAQTFLGIAYWKKGQKKEANEWFRKANLTDKQIVKVLNYCDNGTSVRKMR
jgi:TPR repeat protein